jgi:hypothetical protein
MKRAMIALLLTLSAAACVGQVPAPSVPDAAGKHGSVGENRVEFNAANTPGWAMMTPEERQTYRDRMQGFTSYTECKAYYDNHTRQMRARASERQLPFSGQQMDPCITLQ